MKVIDNRKKPTICFANIKVGETFYSQYDGKVFLRIACITDHNTIDDYNVVNLTDGSLSYFGANDSVEKVKAELTITNL